MEFPLHDISSTGRCALLLHDLQSSFGRRGSVGLIVSYRGKKVPRYQQTDVEATPALCVRSEGHILAFRCKPSEILMLSTCERIATQLRGSVLTRRLCAIKNQEGEEYQRAMDELQGERKRLMRASRRRSEISRCH